MIFQSIRGGSYFLIIFASAISFGCAKQEKAPQPQQQPQPQSQLPPLKSDEIQAVVDRVYKNAIKIEGDQNPIYVVGDFNADQSQDLAIVVKPSHSMLKKINSEFANWTIVDPQKVVLPDLNKVVQPLPPIPEPVRVLKGDLLLAVIHGYGVKGWRNPEARQTYLLRNAVGANMKTKPIKALPDSVKGNANIPNFNGDVITQMLSGKEGFIYWTGANYARYK